MKNRIFIVLMMLSAGFASAQAIDMKPVPQINVAGQGKVKVTPDQVTISIGIETIGANATDVKKQNDTETEKVVQYLKKANLQKGDVQTQRVSLQPNYDYQKKKYSYRASQTIQVILRDLNRYDEIMGGLTESGINLINNVEFQSSKIEQSKSEARKLAMQDAKNKAQDYVSVLNQKVGKAITISDNSEVHFPSPVMFKMAANAEAADSRETLALGDIEVTANVQVSFSLE
ncbi:SIMPL domain-containing protein [Flavobacterium silvaticum]|uniref:SIMPL domain-containing protein n=1 Tax=Flavobacterium silvaticum TaxID=1852020 RepID=A0A972JG99_9FLAO|nr:SIMPL domain-containing protein [Flavobacterium silvaticum]NMH28829.1 SIMPL domain-containing protein [Flavobacterium silvaticum]